MCKLFLSFHRLIAESLLESQKRHWIGVFKTVGTVKAMVFLDGGVNEFYIMRWPWAFGTHGQSAMI